jgi:hypothetical protein
MWMIGLLMRGAIEMVMIEWARMDLEERPHSRIVQVDVWIGDGVLWMWFVKLRSRIKTRIYLWKLKRRVRKGKR